MKLQRMFAAAKKDLTLELLCYDAIGASWDGPGITASAVAAQIKSAGAFDRIALRINSPGGDAFEGVAIYNLLRSQQKPVSVFIDGLAASAASIVAMAGDERTVGEGAMLMIHNAWSMAIGDAGELRKIADTLDKVSESIAQTYVARTGKPLAEVQSLMAAETWLSAEDALKEGFATALAAPDPEADKQARKLRASFDLRLFTKAPATLLAAAADDQACACPCPPCSDDGDCAQCSHENCECAGCDCPQHTDAQAKTEAPAEAESNLSLFEARLRLRRQ